MMASDGRKPASLGSAGLAETADKMSSSAGVDGLEIGGVGPRDTHRLMPDDGGTELPGICSRAVLWATSTAMAFEAGVADFLPTLGGPGGPNFT